MRGSTMATMCLACNEAFDKPPFIFISCICCNRVFHCTVQCSKTSPEEIQALLLPNRKLDFGCEECRSAGGVKQWFLEELRKRDKCFDEQFGSVENACDTIKKNEQSVSVITNNLIPDINLEITSLRDTVDASPSFTAWEIGEREKCGKNLLIHKAPDSNKIQEDIVMVETALSRLDPAIIPESIIRVYLRLSRCSYELKLEVRVLLLELFIFRLPRLSTCMLSMCQPLKSFKTPSPQMSGSSLGISICPAFIGAHRPIILRRLLLSPAMLHVHRVCQIVLGLLLIVLPDWVYTNVIFIKMFLEMS